MTARSAEDTINELWRAHGMHLMYFARMLSRGDVPRAEDIVQETMLRAWRHVEILDSSRGSVRPWLTTIARRVAIDMWRSRSRLDEVPADNNIIDTADPLDGVEQAITKLDVQAALATLSASQRAVIMQLYYRGQSIKEAAENLGIPEGTVKSRAHYGLLQLRQALTVLPAGTEYPIAA